MIICNKYSNYAALFSFINIEFDGYFASPTKPSFQIGKHKFSAIKILKILPLTKWINQMQFSFWNQILNSSSSTMYIILLFYDPSICYNSENYVLQYSMRFSYRFRYSSTFSFNRNMYNYSLISTFLFPATILYSATDYKNHISKLVLFVSLLKHLRFASTYAVRYAYSFTKM